jgi:ribosomal protein S27AE
MAINIGLWMNFAAFFSFAVAADHELKQMHYPGVFSNKAWPAFLGALFLAAILNGTIRFKCPNCGRRAAIPYVVFFGPHLDKSIRWCGRCGLKFRPLARGEWEKVGEDEARSKTSASSRNPGRFLEAKKAELARCISLLAALSS